MKKLPLLAITLVFSVGALADCELSNTDESSIASCYEKQTYGQVLKKLNTLKELSKDQISFNPNIIKELNKSQIAWITYRDSYCDTYSNYHGEKNNHSNCINSLNTERAKQIQLDIDAN